MFDLLMLVLSEALQLYPVKSPFGYHMIIRSFGIFVIIMISPEKYGGPTAKFCICGFVYVTHMCLAERIAIRCSFSANSCLKCLILKGKITGQG